MTMMMTIQAMQTTDTTISITIIIVIHHLLWRQFNFGDEMSNVSHQSSSPVEMYVGASFRSGVVASRLPPVNTNIGYR
jgi:hypothetical protein